MKKLRMEARNLAVHQSQKLQGGKGSRRWTWGQFAQAWADWFQDAEHVVGDTALLDRCSTLRLEAQAHRDGWAKRLGK